MKNFVVGALCLLFSVFFVTEVNPQSRVNPLVNTTWKIDDAYGGIGAAVGVYMEITLNFGESNYRFTANTVSSGIIMETVSYTGTYSVSGDKVKIINADGEESEGILIGNSFTYSGFEFRKVR